MRQVEGEPEVLKDEAEHIERARSGNSQSFRQLMEFHGPPLYRMLLRSRRGNMHDAEDLYQETLLKVAVGMRSYQHQGSFRSWVFRIARNLMADQARRKGLPVEGLADEIPTVSPVGARLARGELQRDISQAVDGLSPKLREVFLLRHDAELSFREIAELLHAPLGTVLARMTYAVQALRPRLAWWRKQRAEEVAP